MSDITANVVVSMPNQLFTLARSFKAASGGKIYIGQIDTDPVNPANQIQVYLENEDGSHVPVAQPIIINAGGYPVYNGQVAKFVTVQGHSMAIYDAYGSQQFYFPNVLKYNPDQLRQDLASGDIGKGADLVMFRNSDGQTQTVGDFLRSLSSGDAGKGSDLIMFRSFIGTTEILGSYLREGYILVSSRDELVSAVNYVNNTLKKPTEIRLARNFAPWTAATTDIDFTWVKLKGSGGRTVIDATGIPNAEGNYWIRAYNSGASNISSLNNIYGRHIEDVFVNGPGRTSLVDCVRYHSPEGGLAGFSTQDFATMSFRDADSYRTNAYIIKHDKRNISRCQNGINMPSGFSNYGEAIEYHATTISTSVSGTGILCANANGDIRMFGGSLDYLARIAVTSAGRIILNDVWQEFNNANNLLTGIPYETSTAATAEIAITKGRILGFTTPLPSAVTTIFNCGAGTNGINLDGTYLSNISLASGLTDLNAGTGPFLTNRLKMIPGGGNTGVPMFKSYAQNLIPDPDFTSATITDWYISEDNSPITSRVTGNALNITPSTDTARTGTTSMKITKVVGSGTASAVSIRVPVYEGSIPMYDLYLKGTGLTGSIFVQAYFSADSYVNQYGTPIPSRNLQFGPTRTIDASTLTDWVRVAQQSGLNYTPSWARFVLIRVQIVNMSAGALYLDDARITQL